PANRRAGRLFGSTFNSFPPGNRVRPGGAPGRFANAGHWFRHRARLRSVESHDGIHSLRALSRSAFRIAADHNRGATRPRRCELTLADDRRYSDLPHYDRAIGACWLLCLARRVEHAADSLPGTTFGSERVEIFLA